MAALSASKLVCWEMLVITSRICPMLTVLLLRVSMLPHESLILADSCCIAAMVLSTTC
ncbi:hypothetical protein D9M71_559390 [compost metagenome]